MDDLSLTDTTAAPAATAPSAPGNLSATAGDGRVALSWGASTEAGGTVSGYRVMRNGTQIAQVAGTSYTDTGLTDGTSYSYSVVAYDSAGNVSPASNVVSATPGDTTPPSVPTNLTATGGSGQVSLSWTASNDNVAVAGYDVYRNGSLVGRTSNTSYVDSGLTGGTSYSYAVAAYDAAGNVSSPTASVTATPTAAASSSCGSNQTWAPSTLTGKSSGGVGEYKYSPMSDAAAAACVPAGTDTVERRTANAGPNAYVPSQAELAAFYSSPDNNGLTPGQDMYYPKFVTGGCAAQRANPTTDFLIDCTAYKWGIPADWLRADYVQESDWRMSQLGDLHTLTASCYALYPGVAQVAPTSAYESMGISQVKWTCDHQNGAGTEPLRWKSTAFNMDYQASTIRFEYDNPNGDRSSWGDSAYQPQQQWPSLCAWFSSYPFNNAGSQSYCASVQQWLAQRTWTGFKG